MDTSTDTTTKMLLQAVQQIAEDVATLRTEVKSGITMIDTRLASVEEEVGAMSHTST